MSEDNAIQLLDDPYYSDQRISEPRIPVLPKIKIPEQIDEERFFSPVIEPEMSRPENLQPMPSQYGSMQNVNSFSRNDVVEDVFDPSSLLGEDLSNLVDEEPFDLSEDSSSFINEEPFDLSEDMVDNPLYPQLEPMNGNLDDLYERERLSNNLSRGSPMGPPEGSPMGLPEEQLDPEVRAGRNLFNFLPFRNYFGQN